jgi:hypothetical protein
MNTDHAREKVRKYMTELNIGEDLGLQLTGRMQELLHWLWMGH